MYMMCGECCRQIQHDTPYETTDDLVSSKECLIWISSAQDWQLLQADNLPIMYMR